VCRRRHGDRHGRPARFGGRHLTDPEARAEEPPRAKIRHPLLEQLLAHARGEAPLECCGLLLGGPGQIEAAFPARNLLASPTRFRVDPRDHFAALRAARGLGLVVVGSYHSHPASPAVPSPRDIAEAADDEMLHIIVSLRDDDIRAYRLQGGNFRPVELVVFS
jgi:proteasome lid subunit RPN8/RPN11